jgi:excinuclease UvrABC nuclease subunit
MKERPYAFSRNLHNTLVNNILEKTKSFSGTVDYIRIPRPVMDSGVYILLENNRPVYVGQSQCVMSRLCNHVVNEPKNFDDVLVIKQNEKFSHERHYLERELISLYKPALNIRGNSDHYRNSMQYHLDEKKAGRVTSEPIIAK